MNWLLLDEKIREWLKEDMSSGDITTDSLIGEELNSSASVIAKENGIIAGLGVFRRVFLLLDEEITLNFHVQDGSKVQKGDILAHITGRTSAILKGERLALNLLQRMSGIATETAKYKSALEGLEVRLVDTRKTMPGLRILDKYAVRAGGGHNHRYNLSEAVLIKDNHIAACGSITKAVEKARANIPHTMKIEVEIETLDQLKEALAAGADVIMLDNMGVEMMKKSAALNKHQAILEASGNVTLENIRQIAQTGIDIISVGALTHSVKALDISLKFNLA